MKKIISKHPLAIRWFHWINFPVLGHDMEWPADLLGQQRVQSLGFGGNELIKFFPKSFYAGFAYPIPAG